MDLAEKKQEQLKLNTDMDINNIQMIRKGKTQNAKRQTGKPSRNV